MSPWAAFWNEAASITIAVLPEIIYGVVVIIATLAGRAWGKHRSDRNWHDDITEHMDEYTQEQIGRRDERIAVLETELTEEHRYRRSLERAAKITKAALLEIESPDNTPEPGIIQIRRRP